MSYYLLDNPNPNGNHFYTTRAKPIQIIVLHTAENLPDFTPPDTGAESVARYASTTSRAVSWHSTVDSDSVIPMIPDGYTGFHVRNYNSISLGLEMATQAHTWVDTPYGWRIRMLDNVAKQVAQWCSDHVIPAKLITKSEVDAGVRGITFHSRLDPTRRRDPGDAFPHPYLLDKVRDILNPRPTEGTMILADTVAPERQAVEWAKRRGAHQRFINVIPLYYDIGAELGVRADGAIAQSYKETNGGHFTGVVPASHNNWCGLKTRAAAGDRVQDHAQFPDDQTGVRAHLEHLSLYAGRVIANPVDPRHFPFISGRANTFEKLGGHWAPNPDYGKSIVYDYLNPLLATEVPPTQGWVSHVRDAVDSLNEALKNV